MIKINPSIGGYFKHNNLVYLAKEPVEPGFCAGCCFHSRFSSHTECGAPNGLNCSGKIFEDVTGRVEVELIDERAHGFFRFFIIVAIWVMVIIYVAIKYNKYN